MEKREPLSFVLSDITEENRLSLIKEFIKSSRENKKVLMEIISECFSYLPQSEKVKNKQVKSGYGGYKNNIEKWMEARFTKDITLTPSQVASEYARYLKIPGIKLSYLRSLAQIVKNRIRMRLKRGKLIPTKNKGIKFTSNQVNTKRKNTSWTANPEMFKIDYLLINQTYVDETIKTSDLQPIFMQYWEKYVKPFRDIFIRFEIYNVVYALFKVLSLYGNCSSLLNNYKYDREAFDYREIKEDLQQINLIEHTFSVLEIALKIKKEQSHSDVLDIPFLLIAALAFDISKIYGADGRFKKIDHPRLSSSILRVLFQKTWINVEKIFEGIESHHESPSRVYDIGYILKEADGKARERQMAKLKGTKSYKDITEWFDLKKYIEILKTYINHNQNNIIAFSHGSTVYISPDILFESVKRLAKESDVFDISLYRSSDRRTVLQKIAYILKQNNFVAGSIQNNYFGMSYQITFYRKNIQDIRAYLLPLKIEIFGMPHEIEKRKKGLIKLIEKVSIVT